MQDIGSAVDVLDDLIKNEYQAIVLNMNNASTLNFYARTSASLQLLLVGAGKHSRATQVAQEWIELSKSVIALPTAREPQWLFAIDSNHTAGHFYQQIDRNTDALERYSEAIANCQDAFKRDFRTSAIISHEIELHMHLFEILLQSKTLPEVVHHFEQAVELTQELMKLTDTPEKKSQAARDQLKLGLDKMRTSGYPKEADVIDKVDCIDRGPY